MKKIKKFLCMFATSLMIISTFYNTNVLADQNENSYKRISGKDRYETSVSVGEEGWKDGAQNIIIASGEDFADALCAAPLAKSKNAPILLTNKDKLNAAVKDEIKKLNSQNVIIVGGEGAVSSEVEKEINEIENVKNVERIYGKDRYETSLKVAQELGEVEDVVVATGLNYADALSIAPIAAQKKMPILLVSKYNMRDDIKNYVNEIEDLNKAYVLGGEGVVPQNIFKDLPKSKAVRIFGDNRYETNVSIMNEFKNELNFKKAYIATAQGENSFADALSGSVLAALTNSPIILVGETVDEKTQEFITNEFPNDSEILVIGGEGAVSDEIADMINQSVKESKNVSEKINNKKTNNKSDSDDDDDDDSSSEDVMKASIEVNQNKITLTISNVVDKKLTITVYDENGNLAHVGETVGRFAITDEDLKHGRYKYQFSLDKGTYYGYVYGEKLGKIKINTFNVN